MKPNLENLATAQSFYEARIPARQQEECLDLALKHSTNEEARRRKIKYTDLVKLNYIYYLSQSDLANLHRKER